MAMTSWANRFATVLMAAWATLSFAAGEPPAPVATCYLGESTMTTPDGKPIRTTLSLVKRVVNEAAGRIEEHVLSVNERNSKAFVVTMEVSGNHYTISEKSGAFTGEGELKGEPWHWKEWKSVTRLADGAGTVTSTDTLTDHGLHAAKTFAGPDGTVSMRIEETLATITPRTYEVLYARLAPANGK
jgi:hypothetical protein